MRTLATTVVSQVLLATVTLTGAWASAGPDKTSKKTVNRVMFDEPDVRATVHGSQASIRSKAELNLATDDVETRLFRNTGVSTISPAAHCVLVGRCDLLIWPGWGSATDSRHGFAAVPTPLREPCCRDTPPTR